MELTSHFCGQVRRLARLAVVSSIVGGLAVAPAIAQDKAPAAPPPKSSPSAASPTAAIPVDEVATQASQVPKLIRTLTEPLAPDAEIAAIRQRLPELHEQVDRSDGRRSPPSPRVHKTKVSWRAEPPPDRLRVAV